MVNGIVGVDNSKFRSTLVSGRRVFIYISKVVKSFGEAYIPRVPQLIKLRGDCGNTPGTFAPVSATPKVKTSHPCQKILRYKSTGLAATSAVAPGSVSNKLIVSTLL